MVLFKITRESGIPLIGTLYFGIVDRGSNILEIRPNCSCNLNCSFCSVDAGPFSKTRRTNYEVEFDYLMDWIKYMVEFKEIDDVECHIDSTGEPMLYPNFIELVKAINEIPNVKGVTTQGNGTLFTKENLKQLAEAGLKRINLSIHAMDPKLAKELAGMDWYDIEKIKKVAKWIMDSKIDLMITPVFLPNLNDDEIPKIIEFAKSIGAKLGIQKFEKYKFGRKPRGIKIISWWKFYNKYLKEWAKKYDLDLKLSAKDFNIHPAKILPIVMEKGEKVNVKIVGPGWLKNEKLGVARDRCVSILDCPQESGQVKAKIVSNKHNIYVAVLK